MKTRMSITYRSQIFEEYAEKIQELRREIEDGFESVFAPYDSRNYEEGCPNTHEYDDKDAEFVEKLLGVLEEAEQLITMRCLEACREECRREDALMFYWAWEVGLCPAVMNEYSRTNRYVGEAGDSRTWSEISSYRKTQGISRQGTLKAVEDWQASVRSAKWN